jgi:dTDP-4-amino-4,6-dideoxygalactose transaminase
MLDVSRGNQPLREDFLAALASVIDSGRFLFGEEVARLERQLAQLHQVDHAVACANGSDALLLALMALDIGPGDEVIVPSFTFFATASCVARLGAKIVFVDIEPKTFNIDPDAVAAAITPRTRAIIPVHLFGQAAAIDRICQMADAKGIHVVEDAAQAVAAAYRSRPVGSWGLVGCLSFYPTKNMGGMGDGGMLLTRDAEFADRLRLFAGHGMRPRYYHQVVGINSRLDSFQAAVLEIKLKHLPSATVARQVHAARYRQLLEESGLTGKAITLPVQDPAAYHVWNQFTIRVPAAERDAVRTHLQQRGIGSEIYYPVPLHRQVCFESLGYEPGSLPHTERACSEVISLPMYAELTADEQVRVVEGLASYFRTAAHRAAA